MSHEDFETVWEKLNSSPHITNIFVNSVGDFYSLDDYRWYATHIEENKKVTTSITTNGLNLSYVPKVDVFVISFNGCDKETYEYTTGNNFEYVVKTIKGAYDQLETQPKKAELHCLAWEGNPDPEDKLMELFGDFPGKIRISYKVENQFGDDMCVPEYRPKERNVCDYLTKLIVYPTCDVIQCSHDFGGEIQWGNLRHDSVAKCFYNMDRAEKLFLHKLGKFCGLCEKCNYNSPVSGRLVYIK